MNKSIDIMKSKEYNYQDVNYYHLPELDYNEPDAFNQPDDLLEVFHI